MSFSQGHAIVVGVGADLQNTVDDAKAIAAILRDQQRCAYPKDQVILLTEGDADRDGVLRGFERLAAATDEESTVIVYYSGHGYRVTAKGKTDYFLLPFGYALDRLPKTAISDSEFAAALKRIKVQKLLVLLDCCHAAGIDQMKTAGLKMKSAPIPPQSEAVLKQGNGRASLTSSQAGEVSFAGKPYSVFTIALIEGLSGSGTNQENGYVNVADLAMYTSWRVAARTRGRQHPVFKYTKADNFDIAYYAAGDRKPKGPPFDVPTEVEPEPGQWARAEGQAQAATRGNIKVNTIKNKNVRAGGHIIQAQRDANVGDMNIGPRPSRRRKKGS